MLRFKPEVRVVFFTEQLLAIFQACTLWSFRARVDVEINSVDDGADVHKVGTLHGRSLAADLDTVGDKQTDTLQLAEYLRVVLPPQYDVIYEGDHVHVEWDARRPPLRRAV